MPLGRPPPIATLLLGAGLSALAVSWAGRTDMQDGGVDGGHPASRGGGASDHVLLQSVAKLSLVPQEDLAEMLRQMEAKMQSMEKLEEKMEARLERMDTDAARDSRQQGAGGSQVLFSSEQPQLGLPAMPPANRSDELFEACRAKPSGGKGGSLQMIQARRHARGGEATSTKVVAATRAACAAGELPLTDYRSDGLGETCCPASSTACAGCASAANQQCQRCAGGFVSRGGLCVACSDSAGWMSAEGLTCSQLDASACSDVRVRGRSSNEACCKCGGGHGSATPFQYESHRWALKGDVELRPVPRTAERYSLDEGCQLADYNLTMDGATGMISAVPGLDKPREPFSVQCEVTAHQSPSITFTATVLVAVDYLAFGVPLLLLPQSSQQTFPAQKAPGAWKDFGVHCAPQTEWLHVDPATGDLNRASVPEASADGAVSTAAEAYIGQSGGICLVTGFHQPPGATHFEKRHAKVVALWPRPWSSLHYNAASVEVTVGEDVPTLQPIAPSENGLLKPSDYVAACDAVGHADKPFVFDSLVGAGLLAGHPVFEITKDGAVSVSPAASLAQLFDDMPDVGGTRKSLALDCAIWGVFPDASFPPIQASLSIELLDSMCWVSQTFRGSPQEVSGVSSEAHCRSTCRMSHACSHFQWEGGKCYRYRVDGASADEVTAFAKVTGCTAQSACLHVSLPKWYQSGDYCPLGPDLVRGGVVYRKDGATKEETLLLSTHRPATDGAEAGCSDGDWIVRRADPARDYMLPESGHFEFGGLKLACLPASSGSVQFAVASCPAPNLTAASSGLQPLVADDPSTPEPADHWLHPCDCMPPAWGIEPPVSPEAFEAVPPNSGNSFIPPPFQIVSGQFVCPARSVLLNGVHFETDTEAMEREDCEARCKDEPDCNFFWHGTQQGANTCRLFASCDHLVRELGLEGRLSALPRTLSCQVADPETCWATTLRRQSLSSAVAMPFRYWPLHQQCDEALLLGGSGVDQCARPTYRAPLSHPWSHKRPLPDTFRHGTELVVSCWEERYAGLSGAHSAEHETLHCVNGEWFNSADEPGLASFSCGACVQVSSPGYTEAERRNEQELYFFNRMQLSLFTEVLAKGSDHVHCLEPGLGDEEVVLQEHVDCGATLRAEAAGITSSDSRHLHLLKGGANQCLEGIMEGDSPVAVRRSCSSSTVAQQLPMDDVPGLLWRLHSQAHEQAGHRLAPGLIDCAGRGAVGRVDFGHLFKVSQASIAAFVGRFQLPVSHAGVAGGTWTQVSDKAVGFSFTDYPGATRIRGCISFTDSSPGVGSLKMRLRRTDGAGGAVFFQDDFGFTWSGSGLVHHACGQWHLLGSVDCGYSWGNTCQVDMLHAQGIQVTIHGFDVELGSDDVALATSYRGRFDVPVAYDGGSSATAWQQINDRVALGFDFAVYGDATQVRGCLVFTDSSTGALGVKIRLRRRDDAGGTVFFEDNFGGTFSASGLIHHDCGQWHDLKDVSCGYSWGDSCQVDMTHEQGMPVKIYGYDLEFRSTGSDASWAYVGRTPVAAGHFQDTPTNTWLQVSKGGVGLQLADYPDATEVRACVAFTDKSTGSDGMKIRLRRMDHSGGVVFFEDQFSETFSNNGLIHNACGAWRPLKLISCGNSWLNTCQVDMMHTQGVDTDLFGYSLEFRATLPRDVCRFAPVISQSVAVTAELYKVVSPTGVWPEWQYKVADAPVMCSPGSVLIDLNLTSQHLEYKCGVVAGLGACIEGYSPQADVQDWQYFQVLGKLSVACGSDALLSGFHFEFSEGGKWGRFRYSCCKAAGAPTALVPTGPQRQAAGSLDGTYCPIGRDDSGRLRYRKDASPPPGACQVVISGLQPTDAWMGGRYEYDAHQGAFVYTQCSLTQSPDDAMVWHLSYAGHAEYYSLTLHGTRDTSKLNICHATTATFLGWDYRVNFRTTTEGAIHAERVEVPRGQQMVSQDSLMMDLVASRQSGEEVVDIASGTNFGSHAVTLFDGVPVWDLETDVLMQVGSGGEWTVGREYTSCAWVFPRTTTSGWLTLFRGSQDHALLIAGSNRHLGMYSNRNGAFRDTGFAVDFSQWNFLCVVGRGDTDVSAVGTSTFYAAFANQDRPRQVGTADRVVSGTSVQSFGNPGQGPGKVSMSKFWNRVLSLQEIQALFFDTHPQVKLLEFNPDYGLWCIWQNCTSTDPSVDPVGISAPAFEVVAISDFTGQFEGKGAPQMNSDNRKALAARLKSIRAPKRPPQPRKPALEGFTVEEPKYEAECMDYGDLWRNIQESYKDAAGQLTSHSATLAAEPLDTPPQTHPCEVAAGSSGTRGKIGGGDGQSTPAKMSYDEIDSCSTRDISRGLKSAQLERDGAVWGYLEDVFSHSLDLLCDVPPNIETAPMGIGAEMQPEEFCTDGKNFAESVLKVTNMRVGIGLATAQYDIAEEDYNDCDPLQVGLARLFCDIHCVRDAVVRGDRSILRNLKSATDITNRNMKALTEWSASSAKAETGWLAAKMDVMEERTGLQLKIISDTLAGGSAPANFLARAKTASETMLNELSGFAHAASFSAVARTTARDALESFTREAQVLDGSGGANASRAAVALSQLASLHAVLQAAGGASKAATVGAQLRSEAVKLQQAARTQLQTLGVYREHSNFTGSTVRSWSAEQQQAERRSALLAMDRLWWQLRNRLDEYLDAAEEETSAFQSAFEAMADYEHCSVGLSAVSSAYGGSLAARDHAHKLLKSTWREGSNLIGELAAVIVDGDVFSLFVQEEGCDSALAKQTLRQARFAVGGMKLLVHRFEVGGLGRPEVQSLAEAVRRIKGSYQEAHKGCT